MWHRRAQRMTLRTGVGPIDLQVWYGYDPGSGSWGCPVRQRWGLPAHQRISPALEDKVVFTATATGTYEQAAAVASKWGSPMDDSTVHALVQRIGTRAEAQARARLKTMPQELEPGRAATDLAVIMIDAWLARYRGPGWGKGKTTKPRVEWHELKTGVFYRQEHASVTESGRGVLAEKVVVSWQGEALELGARLHHEAMCRGLARARNVAVVADGAGWIWNLVEERWAQARQVLDFYHASQHLWALGYALRGQDQAQVRPWVEKRLHRLRHGQERAVLKEISGLKAPPGEAEKIVPREQNYFATQARRMAYGEIAERGWPIGSGAVESACRQRQCRYKRPGQFWTTKGLRHLCALEEARTNNHWDQLWPTA